MSILKSGRNVFLTGSAGTGKTYVLKVNRVVLFVTLSLVGIFLLFLLLKRKAKAKGV